MYNHDVRKLHEERALVHGEAIWADCGESPTRACWKLTRANRPNNKHLATAIVTMCMCASNSEYLGLGYGKSLLSGDLFVKASTAASKASALSGRTVPSSLRLLGMARGLLQGYADIQSEQLCCLAAQLVCARGRVP